MRRIRGAAALWGHPPRAYRQSPRASRLFATFVAKCAASPAFRPKFPKLNALRGTSPPHPLVSLATPRGQGERRKRRAPYHLPLRQSVFFWRGGKGYPKRFIKTIKPSLQIFLDVLPLPWYKLLKPGGAAPARLHEILCGYKKRRQPPKQGREACTLAVRLWYMRSQS